MSRIYPDFAFNNPIRRGDILICEQLIDGYLDKIRPVVVVQNDKGNQFSRSVVVAAMTSKPKKDLPVNVVIDPVKYGLEVEHSTIMLNHIFTVDKDYLRKKQATLDAEDIRRLDEGLRASLNLNQNQEVKGMEQLQKVFNYQGNQVRTVLKDGEPWFVATDVCMILEIDNPSQALTRLDADERNTIILNEGIGNPTKSIVSESGLYSLVLSSRKPEAKAFKRWITHDVIPQIRKTGSYSVQPQSIEDLIIMQAQSMKDLKTKVNQLEDSQKTIKETIVYRPDNWRNEINKMFDRVARANDNRYRDMRAESYRILEERAGCDLEKRLDNLKDRKREAGSTMTEVNRTNKIDVIEADPKLREIYTAIIKELVIKYVA
jgi:prophage antirepressor-like protein/mRNA-degrading endonuclease toxin of MazEF toxin-antitoxin module